MRSTDGNKQTPSLRLRYCMLQWQETHIIQAYSTDMRTHRPLCALLNEAAAYVLSAAAILDGHLDGQKLLCD